MLKARVMPCLLLRGPRLVKTVKFKNPSYVGDPINAVRIYNDKEVDELILLDITATIEERQIQFDLLFQIASECFMPVTYGGGIRHLEDIKTILGLGMEKVSINSYAFENPSFIKEASDLFGSQSIVVSIDVKRTVWGGYEVYTRGGRKPTGFDPVRYALHMESLGAGEILISSIDRDGMMNGYDVELVKRVTAAVQLPVIACGGAGKVEDFGMVLREGGGSAAAAGSMVVYQGKNRAVLINFPSKVELKQVLG